MDKNEFIKTIQLLVTKEVSKQIKQLEKTLIAEIKKNKILDSNIPKNTVKHVDNNINYDLINKNFAKDPLLNSILKETAIQLIEEPQGYSNIYESLENSYSADNNIKQKVDIGDNYNKQLSPQDVMVNAMSGRYAKILKKSYEFTNRERGK